MIGRARAAVLSLMLGLTAVLPVIAGNAPASAAESEPAVINTAWYWRDSRSEDANVGGNVITLDTNNPYCPTSPSTGGSTAAEDSCAPGRLPTWIRNGDFENPYMSSVVEFDLSLVPLGATVDSFTVTFLEADCDANDGDPSDRDPNDDLQKTDTPQCAQFETPINPTEFHLQACVVNEIFGASEARPVKERPRHDCSQGVTGERKVRKAPKNKTTGQPRHLDDHVWVFDLTEVAEQWVSEITIPTAILLRAELPRAVEETDQFRVVLSGINARRGVETELRYHGGTTPPPPTTPPPTAPPPFDPGTTTETGTTTTTTTGIPGTTGTTGTTPTTTTPATPTSPAPEAPLAGEGTPASVPMPGYVWLAVLAGIIAFSLVRSVVIPATTGIRPDGVLARITHMNAERRGATVAATTAGGGALAMIQGAFGSMGRGVKQMSQRFAGLTDKLPFRRS